MIFQNSRMENKRKKRKCPDWMQENDEKSIQIRLKIPAIGQIIRFNANPHSGYESFN